MEQGAVCTGGNREIRSLKNMECYDSAAAAMRCQKLKKSTRRYLPFFSNHQISTNPDLQSVRYD